MTQAHYVKKARKNHPEGGIKKGESYYWWAFMVGGRGGPKHYSKAQPKRSQLTQSDFFSALYDIEDELSNISSDMGVSDMQSTVENAVSELENLKDETQGKFDNMPESLQQGDTGQLLEERVSEVESMIDELQGIDFSAAEEEEANVEVKERETKEGEDEPEEETTAREAAVDEISNVSYSGS